MISLKSKPHTKHTWTEHWFNPLPEVHILGWKDSGKPSETWLKIVFQDGPVAEVGTNGICMLDVLDALIDRLQQFDKKWPCQENKQAIGCLHGAQEALKMKRQRRRTENAKIVFHRSGPQAKNRDF